MPPPTIQQIFQAAVAHHQAGRLAQAEKLYRQVLSLEPRHAEAMHYLGALATQGGRHDIAVELIRQSIALNPHSAVAHSNLAVALRENGQLEGAIAAAQIAVALDPEFPEAHNTLGVTLKLNRQNEQAIAAFAQAITLRPHYPEALSNLGNVLRDVGRLNEAVEAFHRAIALNPNHAKAHNNLGVTLRDQGRLDEAIAAFRRVIELQPELVATHSNLVYLMHYHPGYDAKTIVAELRAWNRLHAEPLKPHIQAWPNDPDPKRRLRIGFVSPDFRNHVVGRNLLPLFGEFDRQRFEIICYAQVLRPDEITAPFQQCAAAWRTIVGVSDEQVARQIRQDRIDILVDLSLHSAQNRLLLFARKPAPVQATFAGYPGSTGLTAIDYRLSDPYLDPPDMDESVYSERTVRLPDTFWCYDPLDCSDIPVNALPALEIASITFGCLNNFCKVNDTMLAIWAEVLRQVRGSRLLLLAKQGDHRERTLAFLAGQGVEAGRVEFLDPRARRRYLELYHRIDLGLDSFPYNGHTTSLDSFWMGVPVVTLVGQTAVARAGWCQLSNLGLTELAAGDREQFVRIATELANDIPRLSELRATLRERMERSPLMDAPRFARNIEAAFREMWRTWCNGGG
jgi:predicted O-linked N-acetylglucosamine transferase (SPINDLY family)